LLTDAVSTQANPDVTKSVPEALDRAFAVAKDDDIICVTGSLYVVAEAREHILATEQAQTTAQAFRP